VLLVIGDFVDLYDWYTNRNVPYEENYVSEVLDIGLDLSDQFESWLVCQLL
jgi:hypothetical protein